MHYYRQGILLLLEMLATRDDELTLTGADSLRAIGKCSELLIGYSGRKR